MLLSTLERGRASQLGARQARVRHTFAEIL